MDTHVPDAIAIVVPDRPLPQAAAAEIALLRLLGRLKDAALDSLRASCPPAWRVETLTFSSGAVLIRDADHKAIGWATDANGRTLEEVLPLHRHPDEIARNGHCMAQAPVMLHVCRLMVAGMQTHQARAPDAPLPAEWLVAAEVAAQVLAAVGEAP